MDAIRDATEDRSMCRYPNTVLLLLSTIAALGCGTIRGQSRVDANGPLSLGGGLTLDLIAIPAGSFTMGSSQSPEDVARLFGGRPESYLDEHPVHAVELDPFWIGRTEVTVDQFTRFVEATGHVTTAEREGGSFVFNGRAWEKTPGVNWRNPGFSQSGDHPVVCVAWHDAVAFCEWLSAVTGRRFALPTEAQWEYACRAGSTSAYPWGDDPAAGAGRANAADRAALQAFPDRKAFAWDDGYVHTAPVASFQPNAFGLYDMIGNVWEWTADWYAEDAYATASPRNPAGPATGEHRVLRGGCWLNDPGGSRIADRNAWPAPSDPYGGYGFRVVVRIE
jgi:formylglycine-generating enzyme required for sulfatase activity